MKTLILTMLCSAALTGQVLAQGAQAEMVKQRAKALQQQNNVNQGVVPPPAPAPVANPQPAAPPAPRGIDPAQQALRDKLQADLAAIKAGIVVTAEQKQQLLDDVLALSKGVVRPSKEMVAKLAEDISAALAEKNATVKDAAKLAQDINVVVNSLNLPPAQVQTFVTNAQSLLKSGGSSDPAAQTVLGDLNAIIADLQKNKPKLYQ